jgi:hypothetical protein
MAIVGKPDGGRWASLVGVEGRRAQARTRLVEIWGAAERVGAAAGRARDAGAILLAVVLLRLLLALLQ